MLVRESGRRKLFVGGEVKEKRALQEGKVEGFS